MTAELIAQFGATGAVLSVIGYLLRAIMIAWRDDRADARLERQANRELLQQLHSKVDELLKK